MSICEKGFWGVHKQTLNYLHLWGRKILCCLDHKNTLIRLSRVFSTKHTTKYETLTIHFLHFMRFCVLLMPRKNKSQNPLIFRVNADPGAECKSEERGAKREKSGMKYHTIHFSFFSVRKKCIASHTVVHWASLIIVPAFPDRLRHLSFFYSISSGTFETYCVFSQYQSR